MGMGKGWARNGEEKGRKECGLWREMMGGKGKG